MIFPLSRVGRGFFIFVKIMLNICSCRKLIILLHHQIKTNTNNYNYGIYS